ncbi:hypothetical protein, partial [Fictibacillus sp. NRS-1165]|uniref:hypothetical protein n=1 Tax=Fictibacillus sp. NRS-1165 TaxID=3144463 RepID=UPI003D205345
VYTLRNDRKAETGDYILIHNPLPDSLDTYSLNEIEEVETADHKGIITSNSHGIKHNEYLLMVPGRADDSHPIDYQDIESVEPENLQDIESNQLVTNHISELLPTLGDIYKKKDSSESFEAMVVAIKGQTFYLGSGLELSQEELMNTEIWEFLYNILDK